MSSGGSFGSLRHLLASLWAAIIVFRGHLRILDQRFGNLLALEWLQPVFQCVVCVGACVHTIPFGCAARFASNHLLVGPWRAVSLEDVGLS